MEVIPVTFSGYERIWAAPPKVSGQRIKSDPVISILINSETSTSLCVDQNGSASGDHVMCVSLRPI